METSSFLRINQYAVLFSLCLQVSLVRLARGEMHIIGDTPFKCNMGTTPRAELSEEDMLHLLQSQGGDLARAYAAPNHMEASLHFMHMLSEGTAHQTLRSSYAATPTRLLKQEVLQSTMEQAKSRTRALQTSLKSSEKSSLRGTIKCDKDCDKSSQDMEKSTEQSVDILKKVFPSLRDRKFKNPRGDLNTFSASTQYDNDRYYLPAELNITGTIHQPPEGSVTTLDYCRKRGTDPDNSGYLAMCTSCAATTTMPSNYWPEVLNEALCIAHEDSCFMYNGQAQGKCHSTSIVVSMLRRREGYCTLVTLDGEVVSIDQWDIYQHSISVGCECAINRNSVFADYLD